MKMLCSLLLFLAVTGSALASEDSHKAAVEKLFESLKMKQQYETSMLAGFNLGASLGEDKLASLPADQQTKVKTALEKVRATLIEMMGWEAVKSDMVALYMKYFSEEEIAAITTMLDTPTGQMLVSKQIQLLPESMTVGQKKMQAVMPEISRIMQETMQN